MPTQMGQRDRQQLQTKFRGALLGGAIRSAMGASGVDSGRRGHPGRVYATQEGALPSRSIHANRVKMWVNEAHSDAEQKWQ